jgi:hypothetical protein
MAARTDIPLPPNVSRNATTESSPPWWANGAMGQLVKQ